MVSLLAAVCASAAPDDGARPLSDTEVWNEGVDLYRAGDVTNAVRVLRPLMLSREYGARAAEVVAKVCYDRAHDPSATDALPMLEEAAAAAQIALRSAPGDGRLERNFTRATDGLAELRETKRIEKVLAAANGRDPGSVIGEAMRSSREIMREAAGLSTNAAEAAVAKADSLSARAARISDAWLQAKSAICQAVTNEEQAATITVQVDQARERTEAAVKALGDLAEDAYPAIAASEQDLAAFYKMTVMPREAAAEDLAAQSNAWLDVEAFNGRDWQREALDYTRAFRARFPAWAQSYEQRAAADTNMPPFTAEAQAQIEALSVELEKRQISCCEKVVPPVQEECMALIRQIIDLLPKDGGGRSGTDERSQPQSGGQDQKPQPQKDRQDEGGQTQGDDGQDDDGHDDAGEEEKKDGGDAGEDESGPGDREVEALLRKAQERSDEHEAEKRARMRRAPLPPNERDW